MKKSKPQTSHLAEVAAIIVLLGFGPGAAGDDGDSAAVAALAPERALELLVRDLEGAYFRGGGAGSLDVAPSAGPVGPEGFFAPAASELLFLASPADTGGGMRAIRYRLEYKAPDGGAFTGAGFGLYRAVAGAEETFDGALAGGSQAEFWGAGAGPVEEELRVPGAVSFEVTVTSAAEGGVAAELRSDPGAPFSDADPATVGAVKYADLRLTVLSADGVALLVRLAAAAEGGAAVDYGMAELIAQHGRVHWRRVHFVAAVDLPSFPADPGQVVTVFDPALELVLREAVDKPVADLTSSDLDPLRELDASRRGITDLSDLANAWGLRSLNLADNDVVDASPLGEVDQLVSLDLGGNGIEDLSWLDHHHDLEELMLGGNRVADLSPLVTLRSLRVLDLGGNAVSSAAELAILGNLTHLDLSDNAVAEVAALAGLRSIEVLDLGGNRIADLSPLAELPALAVLGVDRNRLEGIASLGEPPNLTAFSARRNRIADLGDLGAAPALLTASLADNDLTALDGLAGGGALLALDLEGNRLDLAAGSDAAAQVAALEAAGTEVRTGRQRVFNPAWEAWRETRFDAGERFDLGLSGSVADADGDGFPNWLDFALDRRGFDGLPVFPAEVLEAGGGGGRFMALVYRRASEAPGVDFRVEVSDDFATWRDGGDETPVVDEADLGDGSVEVTVRDSVAVDGAVARFLRLVVKQSEPF